MNSDPPKPAPTDAEMRRRAFDRWENEGGKLRADQANSINPADRESNNDATSAKLGIIRMHLRRLAQLFDSFDHSPFREKDLDRNAEEYIVDSIKELPARAPCEVVIYLDEPVEDATERTAIADAIHIHFSRRAQVSQQNLRQLLRRGSISLAIGLSFLVSFFFLGQLVQRVMGEGQWAFLLRESLLIGGWVAMWKPLEIFLYDWWPIVGERRLYERLSKIKVEIKQADSIPLHAAPLLNKSAANLPKPTVC